MSPFSSALERMGRRLVGPYPRHDLVAGLTTAVMLIPQGMAYAMLAGLPPIVGLYASTVPLVVYSLTGSSRVLAVGPVAMVSLLVASALTPMADAGPSAYVAHAAVLAGLVGLIQLVLGLLRGGSVVKFLSHPVISGFTSAAALIIGFSQLGHLLGVSIARSHHLHTIAWAAIRDAAQINLVTLGLGLASIAALFALKRWRPEWPRALVVVASTTAIAWALKLPQEVLSTIGEVPPGLPAFALPSVELTSVRALVPAAIIISLVAFMESISVAKAFAARTRHVVDANRELVGLGLANIATALFAGYPVTGGFSRTAVNAQAGARTTRAGFVAAAVVVVTLVVLTDLLFFLPKTVLAAVIMTAVFGLVDVAEPRRLWRTDRPQFGLLLLTFVATLSLGIEQGIGVGIGASVLLTLGRRWRRGATARRLRRGRAAP